MADVTISQLTQGTPAGSALLPYSQNNSTNAAQISSLPVAYSSIINKPYMPMASVRRISKYVGNNTDYVVIWDIADINDNNLYNNTNGRFTAPVAGRYYFGVFMISKANNIYAQFFYRKNGVDFPLKPYAGGSSQPYWQVTGFYIFDLAAGDYMDITAPTSYPFWDADERNSGAVFYRIG